jgi:hypothetical protein
VLKADQFAEVANQPLDRITRAIVEFRVPRPDWFTLRHEPQRGCWRCNARHPGGPVLQLLAHHDYVCTRHRVWIGPPDQVDHPQPDLTELPEILAAQHAHRRLLRRLGPAATFDAVLTSFVFCANRWNHPDSSTPSDPRHRWDRRAALLIPPGTEDDTFSVSRLFAITYPEAVSLAEVIGSLQWRRLAAGTPGQQRHVITELGRRLGLPDFHSACTGDAIAHWIDKRCWRHFATPHSDYRSERTFGGKTFRRPVTGADTARKQSAYWFALHRNGGAMMLHHRTITPVRPRELTTSTTPRVGHQHLTIKDLTALTSAEYIRPHAQPSAFLDTATEPVNWAHNPGPRPSRFGQPWSPGT